MIKTIKVKKQLRLDELIKYIFDNGIEDKVFPSNGGSSFDMCETRVSGSGNIKMSGYINEHTTFTVEVEETITEDTKFNGMQECFVDQESNTLEVITHYGEHSIAEVLSDHLKPYNDYTKCLYIYVEIDGKLQLIWEVE